MGIKQSLAYWCLNGAPWKWEIDEICETAKSLGCKSVELAPFEHWPTIRSYGLDIAIAMNGMPNPVFAKGLNNPRYAEEVIARTKAVIDQCADHGVPNVLAFTGYKWSDADDPESEEIPIADGAANTMEGLLELATYAAPRHVTVCLEHLNTRDDSSPMKGHPGYQGDDIDYCAQLIEEVGSPHAKLLFDIYHVAIMHGDVIRRLHQYSHLLGHIHTAGVPGRGELDDNQELNYAGIMRALIDIGYEGYVGQEFIPTRDPAEGLAQAVALCNVVA